MDSAQTTSKASVFLDSSVLFAAAYSLAGGARQLLRCAFRGELVLSTSSFVLAETARNISQKAP
jgi:hypothetical protein